LPTRSTPFPYTTLFRSNCTGIRGSWSGCGFAALCLGGEKFGLTLLFPDRMVRRQRLEIGEQILVEGMTPKGGAIPNDQELAASRSEEHTSELQSPDNLV